MKAGLLLLGALMLPGIARAEGQIDVEVVLFRHLEADPSRIAPVREPGNYEDLRPLAPALEPDAADSGKGSGPREYPHWTTLPEQGLRLDPVVKALARGGAYELILHTGWRQPTEARHRVRLQAGDPPLLDGSLQVLGGGRKMQVVEDFTLLVDDKQVRVQTKQQMRAGELRYVDNDLLGLLIQARPVNSAAESVPAEMGLPPAGSVDGESPTSTARGSSASQVGPAD